MNKKIDYIKRVNIYKEKFPLWAVILFKTIFIVFIICCTFIAVFSFIYIYTPVTGKSMLPTLNSQCYDEYKIYIEDSKGDGVYINRFASATYGDIIVLKNPNPKPNSEYVVKRLIAKGGDLVGIAAVTNETSPANRTYKVFIKKSGSNVVEILEENYLLSSESMFKSYSNLTAYRAANPNKFTSISTSFGDVWFLKIEEDELFYLGDNRTDSSDCSESGAVNKDLYIGRVDIIVYEGQNNFSYIFLYFWHKIFG